MSYALARDQRKADQRNPVDFFTTSINALHTVAITMVFIPQSCSVITKVACVNIYPRTTGRQDNPEFFDSFIERIVSKPILPFCPPCVEISTVKERV